MMARRTIADTIMRNFSKETHNDCVGNHDIYEEIGSKMACLQIEEFHATMKLEKSLFGNPNGKLSWYNEIQFQMDQNLFCTGSNFRSGQLDETEQDTEESLAEVFSPEQPPPGYVCNSCFQTGHYIRYCPKVPPNPVTPYLGPKRCVGVFVCQKCKREWKSKNSFAQEGQMCKKCRITVTPKKQYSVEKAVRCGIYPSRDRRNGSVSSTGTVSSNGPSPSVSPFSPDWFGTADWKF